MSTATKHALYNIVVSKRHASREYDSSGINGVALVTAAAQQRFIMNVEKDHTAPSLSAFSRNIELRVNAGVQSVSACVEKVENKDRVLKHVRDLVRHVSGRIPYGPPSHLFESPLETIFFSEERHSLPAAIGRQQNDGPAHETPSLSPPISLQHKRTLESSADDNFVRLLRCEYGLDPSKKFILILAQLEVLWQPESSQNGSFDKTGVHLDIRFDEAVPAIWELNVVEGLQEGDTFWFGARSAIMTMATAPSLGDLRLSIIAKADDERSQHLGTLTMSSILSCTVDIDETTKSAESNQFPFLQYVHFIAEGRGAQNLHLLESKSEPAALRTTALQTRENLALLSVTVGCSTELAMSVAQLKVSTDDEVDIRGTTQIRPSSLSCIDDVLLSLEAETQTIRELADRRDAFGYTQSDIRQIMELQIVADDNFGLMEESNLGSWS